MSTRRPPSRRGAPALIAVLGTLSAALLAGERVAAAEEALITDVARREIAITSTFTGTDFLLFGTVAQGRGEDAAGDIIVVVRGPPQSLLLRRKERVGPVWINNEGAVLEDVPGFYAVSSSQPVEALLPEAALARRQIGLRHLDIRLGRPLPGAEHALYRAALLARMTADGLYVEKPAGVTVQGGRLFRTELHLPSNTPVGDYAIEVYHVQDQRIAGQDFSTLYIEKRGVEETVSRFAQNQPALYGISAVLIAVAAGWVAGLAFRGS